MVTLFLKTIYKKPNAQYAVKTEISMKTKSFNDSANVRHFPPISGTMTPNSVCL